MIPTVLVGRMDGLHLLHPSQVKGDCELMISEMMSALNGLNVPWWVLLLFNFWLYCLVCVYTSAICAALRDNTSNLCFELKKSENNDFCQNIPLYSITRVVANLRIWLTNFVVQLY